MQKKIMRKVIFLLIAILLFSCGTAVHADTVASGKLGKNITWKLSDSGILNISGKGEMKINYEGLAPWGNDKVKKIVIGSGVTSIAREAFIESPNLEEVTIPGNVKEIGRASFAHCTSLKNLKLESGIKTIGIRAFTGCSSLENIIIPNSVTTINEGAFGHCKELKTAHIGSGVSKIANGMFECCTSLKTVTVSKGVKEVGAASFVKCISLVYIDLPDSVEKISNFAFAGCTNLQLVKLHSKNIDWGEGAFMRCNHVVASCPTDVSYLGILKKQKVRYTTEECSIPKEPVVDVSKVMEENFAISMSWLYQLDYTDVTNPKYIDRISKNQKQVRKLYDDLYGMLRNPDKGTEEKLKNYSIYLGFESSEKTPYDLYVYNALSVDHPELFWARKVRHEEYTDGTLNGISVSHNFGTWSAVKREKEVFDAKVKEIISKTEGMSDYEKVCYFSQYFYDNCEYNWAYYYGIATHPLSELCANTAYGAIVGQKGELGPTCEGFAAGMKVLCDAANINCTIIGGMYCEGENPGPHGWNAIEINGKWYDWEPQHPFQEGLDSYYEPEIIGPITEGFYKTESSIHCEIGTHNWSKEYVVTQKGTCVDDEIVHYICSICGDHKSERLEGTAKGHKNGTIKVIKKATANKSGIKTQYCKTCGVAIKTIKIKPAKISLKKKSITYTGKALKKSSQLPAVIVKDGNGKAISSKYYTIDKPNYKKVKEVGRYAYKVTFKKTCKEYSGKKTIYLEVVPAVKVPLKKLVASSKAITVNWTPIKRSNNPPIHGYEITVATDKKFTKNVKKIDITSYGKSSKKISKLKGNTKYYVQIRTFKFGAGGRQYFAAPSAYKTCTTKK